MKKIFNRLNLIKLSVAELLVAKITLAGLPQYGPSSFTALISQIIHFLQPIIIALSVFMIILSGFQFVLARGNEEKINKAKDTLKWTVIGVIVVVGAELIVDIITEILKVQ